MTLSEFGRHVIRRDLIVQPIDDRACRCYFEHVMFAESFGRCAVVTTIIGVGPTQQRMREDFVQKIRGKVARVYDGMGAYAEYPVPDTLTV